MKNKSNDNVFDSKWRNVAIMIGEKLAKSGPTDYYRFTADEWYEWAKEQIQKREIKKE